MTKRFILVALLAGASAVAAQQTGSGSARARAQADSIRRGAGSSAAGKSGRGIGSGSSRGTYAEGERAYEDARSRLQRGAGQGWGVGVGLEHLQDALDNLSLQDLGNQMEHLQSSLGQLHDWQLDRSLDRLTDMQWPLQGPMPPMLPMPPIPPIPPMPELPTLPVMPTLPSMPSLPPTPDVEFPQGIGSLHFGGTHLAMARGIGDREFASRMPAPWAQSDAADSLYKNARELLNRGDWRRAALALKDIPQKYPNSAYAGEALYWQAWALYRIGGQADLTEALNALDALSSKYANRRSQPDVQALTTRILGTLAARGDAKAAAQLKNRADDKSQSCDREEQAVRAEALNALSRTDPDNMSQLMRSVLARKDECSVQLRKSAVFLVGNKRDSDAGTVLINVAKNDPNMEVRMTAIDWLSRIPGDESLNALAELARGTSEDDAIQRAAVRSLVNHPSDKARQIVRSIVERNDMSERLRSEALSAFSSDRTSVEDVAWLRSVYSKLDNQRLKQRALATIVRVGGPDNDQWLMNIVKDDNEPSDFRATALRRIGQSMSVADLGRMYDGASAQSVRSSLINILGNRKEPEATDKLIDIVKTGTDPSLRTQAIGALANKNDARTRALLLEIINK